MTTVADTDLLLHAERLRGKVVVITGASSGIGRETSLLMAKYGAKVVIGDLDLKGAELTAARIRDDYQGDAVALKCNVLNWEQQVALFEFAMKKHGAIDIVIPNAGVTENLGVERVHTSKGKPLPPNLLTMQVNLIGVLYSSHLANYYLRLGKKIGDLKSLVFIGSMASWNAIDDGPMYSSAKHGVLGHMHSSFEALNADGIRVGGIHPWFADTPIVMGIVRVAMAGLPMTPLWRIASSITLCATDPDMSTSGSSYLLPDDGPVLRVGREDFNEGLYSLIDVRNKAWFSANHKNVGRTALRDLTRLLGPKLVVLSLAFWLIRRVIAGDLSSYLGILSR